MSEGYTYTPHSSILTNMNFSEFPFGPFFLALYLGSSGIRKGSLSPSGGLAAFIIGFTMMAIRLRTFGVALIVFYLVGSKATKVGKELKARLEEGHQEAGYRNAWQVLCNSFSAFLASLLWSALYVPNSVAASLLSGSSIMDSRRPYDFEQWCPATLRSTWSRTLLFVCLGHFACCLGDTLASELGILSTVPPRLITTFKPVPPGTNGGMSLYGTLASAAGGIIMGLTIALSLLLESGSCRREWQGVVFPLLGWGAFAGLFGSFIDSLMGATIQRTRFSSKTKRILTDESPAPKDTEIKVISGINILTNNQVNLLSSIITAVLLGAAA